MDVVNGKIVSARTERSRSDIWSALKPSRSSLLEPGTGGRVPVHSSTGSFNALRGFREFYGSRCGSGYGPPVPSSSEPGWKWCSTDHHRVSRRSHIHHHCTTPAATDSGITTSTHSGCKRLASASSISNAFFDKEMDLYESHVSRAVIGHLDRSVGKALSSSPPAAAAGSANPFKRPRIEPPSASDQVDEPWTAPLRYLLRKVMSASDVGELGRIVLPKKEAEGQLPQIDTKGKQLQMKDYSFSKSWFFHYKWWANNKSRMYVLENTGEFIKYHGLEPNDSFVVYEDGSGNLVARGQKKLTWISQMHSPVNKECSQSEKVEKVVVSKPTAIVEAICCFNSSIPDPSASTAALDDDDDHHDHPSGEKISSVVSR